MVPKPTHFVEKSILMRSVRFRTWCAEVIKVEENPVFCVRGLYPQFEGDGVDCTLIVRHVDRMETGIKLDVSGSCVDRM